MNLISSHLDLNMVRDSITGRHPFMARYRVGLDISVTFAERNTIQGIGASSFELSINVKLVLCSFTHC